LRERVVASFLVRVIHEPGNEQMPWSVTIQHVQRGRVYRLAELAEIGSLLEEIVAAESQAKEAKVIPLDFEKS